MTTTKTVDDLLKFIGAVDTTSIRYQAEKLNAIRDWAVAQLPVAVGDAVTLTRDLGTSPSHGWHHFREALTAGARATVVELDYSVIAKRWQVGIHLDRQWSVSAYAFAGVTRYWDGPAADTPAGYVPPSTYDQEQHPQGKRSRFYVELGDVAKAAR